MSERSLPPEASLRHLKLEAKRLLKSAHASGAPPLKLADAQRLVARDYGFPSWTRLKVRVAELAFARKSLSEQRTALLDAVCAWGWDHPESAASANLGEAIVAAAPPELLQGDFLLACITGDVDAVRSALARDPALAKKPAAPRGWEPLLYVSYSLLARHGRPRAARLVEVAKLLLAHGADPNACYAGGEGYSFPALYASIAVSDNLDLAAALLEAGASPNDRQSLYHAAERFDTRALELLVARGVDPADLSYCLLHKIDFQHEPGIRWFLEHGADPNARHPESQESALHWAIKRASSVAVVELLLARGADPHARTRDGHTVHPAIRASTPLDLALRLARPDLAAVLRAHGAVETPPSSDDALVLACVSGATREPIAELPAEDRDLVAHVAQQGRADVVLRMLELGWPIDARGWMGATPLHWAACHGDAPLARTLLARGAPLVDVGGAFKTPLHTTLHCRWRAGDHVGVLEALVTAGAKLPETPAATGSAELDAALLRLR